ncbi:hypothetical protein T484DRAFT_1973719 [Baffinella frigidus]|nr:hypothetical protein T484DRAFT_1973719 [Cryptophyta sp. CCMP2293]|mmetsp:Transcript_13504/g.30322  ORF Transcript_13504/g.30322 Transcript_13504/m.30322 type:complete len:181 (+) Transcript_13504:2-544(+)
MDVSAGDACKKCGKVDAALLNCAKCHAVKYCGKKCQTADWRKHKQICVETLSREAGKALPKSEMEGSLKSTKDGRTPEDSSFSDAEKVDARTRIGQMAHAVSGGMSADEVMEKCLGRPLTDEEQGCSTPPCSSRPTTCPPRPTKPVRTKPRTDLASSQTSCAKKLEFGDADPPFGDADPP